MLGPTGSANSSRTVKRVYNELALPATAQGVRLRKKEKGATRGTLFSETLDFLDRDDRGKKPVRRPKPMAEHLRQVRQDLDRKASVF